MGIACFLKYYFMFKFYPVQKCVQAFDREDTKLSESSKITKANAAKSIFKDNMHLDALRYIRDNTSKIDKEKKENAAWYLNLEE